MKGPGKRGFWGDLERKSKRSRVKGERGRKAACGPPSFIALFSLMTLLELGCAVGAARRVNGDGGEAEGAIFSRRLHSWSFLFPLQPVQGLDHHENSKSDNDETDDRIEKKAIIKGHGTSILGLGNGWKGTCPTTLKHNK